MNMGGGGRGRGCGQSWGRNQALTGDCGLRVVERCFVSSRVVFGATPIVPSMSGTSRSSCYPTRFHQVFTFRCSGME